jgi:hypothetical protein
MSAMPEFRTLMSYSLRRKGLRGALTVALDGDKLRISATNGATLVIAAGDVERIRAGVDRATKGGPTFETRVWTKGEAGVLLIRVRRNELQNYAAVIGRFAERLTTDKLEVGLTTSGRRWTIGLLSMPLIFALGVWAVPLRDAPLWQGLVVSALPALLLVFAVLTTRKSVPRPAVTHAAFGQALRGEV